RRMGQYALISMNLILAMARLLFMGLCWREVRLSIANLRTRQRHKKGRGLCPRPNLLLTNVHVEDVGPHGRLSVVRIRAGEVLVPVRRAETLCAWLNAVTAHADRSTIGICVWAL